MMADGFPTNWTWNRIMKLWKTFAFMFIPALVAIVTCFSPPWNDDDLTEIVKPKISNNNLFALRRALKIPGPIPITMRYRDIPSMFANWTRRRNVGGDVCYDLAEALRVDMPDLAAEVIQLCEWYPVRFMWSSLSMTATVATFVFIARLFSFKPQWLARTLDFHLKQPQKKRIITVYLCTLAQRSNVTHLMIEILKRYVDDVMNVTYVKLPSSELDNFSFKGLDVVILCHSTGKRQFAITDVKNVPYDKFLDSAARTQGKRRVGIIVHDILAEELNSNEEYKSKMTFFKHEQPSTFKHSNLTMLAGRLDRDPVQLSEDRWGELDVFINEATYANPPPTFCDTPVPWCIPVALLLIVTLVPFLIMNKLVVTIIVGIDVGILILRWPIVMCGWSTFIWFLVHAMAFLYELIFLTGWGSVVPISITGVVTVGAATCLSYCDKDMEDKDEEKAHQTGDLDDVSVQ